MRLDQFLAKYGYAQSRNRAQAMIRAGQVVIDKREITRPSFVVENPEQLAGQIEILDGIESRFVSRAGNKLQNALDHVQLKPTSFICLDLGISTGGFADCLLQNGASKVIGVDVGQRQLAPKLNSDPRLVAYEQINARYLDRSTIFSELRAERFDLIVTDLSFLSLTLVIDQIKLLSQKDTQILALVKPQFEVGPENLNKNGIVKDPALYETVRSDLEKAFSEQGFRVKDYFDSRYEGKDGNKEFFIYCVYDS
jgi:23S rRNA (cytidine1920-2'-O)/16S rRNA (cytidine1409-2'-O)-methyltransferase